MLIAQSCPTVCNPTDCSPPGSSVHGDSPGKNIGVGCQAFLQGIFPTQGLNPGLPHCRQIFYHLSHQEAQVFYEYILNCVHNRCSVSTESKNSHGFHITFKMFFSANRIWGCRSWFLCLKIMNYKKMCKTQHNCTTRKPKSNPSQVWAWVTFHTNDLLIFFFFFTIFLK